MFYFLSSNLFGKSFQTISQPKEPKKRKTFQSNRNINNQVKTHIATYYYFLTSIHTYSPDLYWPIRPIFASRLVCRWRITRIFTSPWIRFVRTFSLPVTQREPSANIVPPRRSVGRVFCTMDGNGSMVHIHPSSSVRNMSWVTISKVGFHNKRHVPVWFSVVLPEAVWQRGRAELAHLPRRPGDLARLCQDRVSRPLRLGQRPAA